MRSSEKPHIFISDDFPILIIRSFFVAPICETHLHLRGSVPLAQKNETHLNLILQQISQNRFLVDHAAADHFNTYSKYTYHRDGSDSDSPGCPALSLIETPSVRGKITSLSLVFGYHGVYHSNNTKWKEAEYRGENRKHIPACCCLVFKLKINKTVNVY